LAAAAIAAGDSFLCVATDEVRCFGNLPEGVPRRVPGRVAALLARNQTLCAIMTTGEAWCKGALAKEPLVAVSIQLSRTSICAVKEDGEHECWGEGRFGQIDAPVVRGVPAAMSPSARAALYDDFKRGFAKGRLPLEVRRNSAALLGPSIPARLAVPLLGARNRELSEFHYGVRVAGLAGTEVFTAYDDVERQLAYYVFDEGGELRELGAFAPTTNPDEPFVRVRRALSPSKRSAERATTLELDGQ
jgi:hypothetical protein